MAPSAGVDLPREKRMEIALTYIFGVGRTRAIEALTSTGISPDKRAKDLTDDELVQLRDYIEANFKVEGDLRREVAADIRRKVEIGCYAGTDPRAACRSAAADTMHAPQGSEADRRRQEEARQEVITERRRLMPPKARAGAAVKKVRRKARKNVAHGSAVPVLQEHHC